MRWFSLMIGMVLISKVASAQVVKETRTSFESGGKTIAMEIFAVGKGPAVVVLHGSDGINERLSVYPIFCRELAKKGYVVAPPHYFERTGTARGGPEENVKHWKEWTETITEAIAKAKLAEGVEGEKVGIVGFSLGSYLGLTVCTEDANVGCMVEYFGGLPELAARRATVKMPPILILHGDKDPIVSVEKAYQLEKVLKAKGTEYEMKIYEGEGHGFKGDARKDSGQRTVKWLDDHLKAGK